MDRQAHCEFGWVFVLGIMSRFHAVDQTLDVQDLIGALCGWGYVAVLCGEPDTFVWWLVVGGHRAFELPLSRSQSLPVSASDPFRPALPWSLQ